jgi:EAL domain-containing protein (putative c-di-GMP-specific phosphodiesterase class I)/CRP-like cAMP-binding protein
LANQKTPTKLFAAGEPIIKEGDEAQAAFVIEHGRVEIWSQRDGKPVVLATLGPGELFGEMAIISSAPRSANATATEDTLLWVITREQVSTRLESSDLVVRLLFNVVLRTLRNEMRLFRDKNGDEDEGIRDEVILGDFLTDDRDAVEKIKFESSLRRAVKENGLDLCFQPIVSLEDSRLRGFEALVRWNDEIYGTVSPEDFVTLAEETTLIEPIGRWMIEQACEHLVRFQREGGEEKIFMNINASGKQLAVRDFPDMLIGIVNAHNLSPEFVKVEITESIVVDNESAMEQINACRDHGFPVVMDDFGTGFSSLSYLITLPISTLKIDKSFVQLMATNERARAIVEAVVGLSRKIGIQVVSEGIETREEMEILRDLKCDFGQGYLFSRPVPAEIAMEMVRRQSCDI